MAERPLILAASVLAVLGGVLIVLIGGLSAIFIGELPATVLSWPVQFLLILATIDGIALVILGLAVWTSRYGQLWMGLAIIVLSILTLFLGELFVPGVVLCVLGGIFTVLHEGLDEQFAQWAKTR
jgi:hypothetical protein